MDLNVLMTVMHKRRRNYFLRARMTFKKVYTVTKGPWVLTRQLHEADHQDDVITSLPGWPRGMQGMQGSLDLEIF